MIGNGKASYSVPPVQRAIKLLRYIGDGHNCANTSKAAKDVGINRTTLLRLLHTLLDERMIERTDDGGGFRLGTGLVTLAAGAVFSRDIVQVSQPVLKQLAADLGLSAHLGVLEDRSIVYLVRETPNLHLVSNVRVGSRLPAHATTIGRIILAHMKPAAVEDLIGGVDLPASTDKTATSLAQLQAQLAEDRAIGAAWSVGNFEEGIGSCAVVIRDNASDFAGAINVTGPDHHFAAEQGRRDEIFSAISAAGKAISTQLGHMSAAHQATGRSL